MWERAQTTLLNEADIVWETLRSHLDQSPESETGRNGLAVSGNTEDDVPVPYVIYKTYQRWAGSS